MSSLISEQKLVCKKFGAAFVEAPNHLKLGAALNVRTPMQPVNGLRHHPETGTCGWFIYAGEELAKDEDFFQPLCVKHLENWRSGLTKYLGLGPGWRFLINEHGYEDVWFDPNLVSLSEFRTEE